MTIFEKIEEAERLRERLRQLNDEISRAQVNCRHDFADPVYDPEEVPDPQYVRLEGHGSDPTPVYDYSRKRLVPRWRRRCKLCGKTEHTDKQKPVQMAPDFS